MQQVWGMDSEVLPGGNLKFQLGSPAMLKMGGGCDGVLNFQGSIPPTVFIASPCRCVRRAWEMDDEGRPGLPF